jgi:hypothetical protein
MPQKFRLIALTFSVLVTLALMPWQARPAMAGFTPTPPPDTPVPTPVNTPIPPPPTNTPQPPPEKPPKDTPVPAATVGLTVTPVVLPVSGGPISGERAASILALMAVAVIAIITGAAARRSIKTRR